MEAMASGDAAIVARAAAPPRFVAPAAGMAAIVVVHAAWMAFRFGGEQATGFADGLGALLAGVVATVLAGRRARARADAGRRLGWLFLSLTAAGFALGALPS